MYTLIAEKNGKVDVLWNVLDKGDWMSSVMHASTFWLISIYGISHEARPISKSVFHSEQ